MTLRKACYIICLILLFICLAVGFGSSAYWTGVVLSIIAVSGWILAKKNPDSGLPHVCLVATISLAVAGILTGAIPWIMICASGFALTVWDVLLLDHALRDNPSDENTRLYENRHLQTLALALGAGLLLIFPGRLLKLNPPFIVLLVCIGLVLYGLDRVWRYLRNKGNSEYRS
jgi:hypothetical protein